MYQSHESCGEANARGKGFSQGFSSSSTYGTSWNVSNTTGEKGEKTQKNLHDRHNKHIARLSLDLLVFKAHLQDAIENLTVPQFVEIRRQFDAIWADILSEL